MMRKMLVLFSSICFLTAGAGFEEKSRPSPQSKPAPKKMDQKKQKRSKIPAPKSKQPSELIGSKEQRIKQNLQAIQLGLDLIQTEEEIKELGRKGVLLELTDTRHYFIDRTDRVAAKRAGGARAPKARAKELGPVFVYPWAKAYLDKLAEDYFNFNKFRKRLRVTSGARSLWFQREMTRKGSPYYTPYAAKAENLLEESLHVRAIAIDISRRGMSAGEIKWMRDRLITDKVKGVEVEEEIGSEEPEVPGALVETEPIEENICYHIVVFPKKQLLAPLR